MNGTLSGDISTAGTLILGATAVLHANIHARSVLVLGKVFGNVTAIERIEARHPAWIVGDLQAPEVVVGGGVIFEGRCCMGPRPAAPPAAEARRRPA